MLAAASSVAFSGDDKSQHACSHHRANLTAIQPPPPAEITLCPSPASEHPHAAAAVPHELTAASARYCIAHR